MQIRAFERYIPLNVTNNSQEVSRLLLLVIHCLLLLSLWMGLWVRLWFMVLVLMSFSIFGIILSRTRERVVSLHLCSCCRVAVRVLCLFLWCRGLACGM